MSSLRTDAISSTTPMRSFVGIEEEVGAAGTGMRQHSRRPQRTVEVRPPLGAFDEPPVAVAGFGVHGSRHLRRDTGNLVAGHGRDRSAAQHARAVYIPPFRNICANTARSGAVAFTLAAPCSTRHEVGRVDVRPARRVGGTKWHLGRAAHEPSLGDRRPAGIRSRACRAVRRGAGGRKRRATRRSPGARSHRGAGSGDCRRPSRGRPHPFAARPTSSRAMREESGGRRRGSA